MEQSFIQGRIDAAKATIVAYEDAELQLATNQIATYTIDTGQTRTVVTRLNITELRKAIDSLYNRCATLQARLNGSGVVNVRPGW